MNNESNLEWVHCNQCLRSTRHELVAKRELHEQDIIGEHGDFEIDWFTTYTMLECKGCGSVTLRQDIRSDDFKEINYYPPQISRQVPHWIYDLPDDFITLLKQIYSALHANSQILALIGARTLIDMFANVTVGDIGGFAQKIDHLVKAGYLSIKNKEILLTALEAGHAAAHRAYNPSVKDVNIVFDIIENILQTIVLTKKADELIRNTPKRQIKSNK
jgi:hypothetical protein